MIMPAPYLYVHVFHNSCAKIYAYTIMKKDKIRACMKSYPWASTVAMLLDSNLISFLRFQIVREQSVINAFSIYVISPCGYVVCIIRHMFHHSGLAFPQCLERHLWRGRYCKGIVFFLFLQIFLRFFFIITLLKEKILW